MDWERMDCELVVKLVHEDIAAIMSPRTDRSIAWAHSDHADGMLDAMLILAPGHKGEVRALREQLWDAFKDKMRALDEEGRKNAEMEGMR